MRGLKDRIAIVTGASKGLGRGIALRLAEEGALLTVCARNTAALESVAEEIRARGGVADTFTCDVTDQAQIAALVDCVAGRHGRIDILVNNAAFMSQPVSLDRYEDDYWRQGIAGGLDSAFYMMRAVFPHMSANGGRIVNMTSMGGVRGVRGSGAYAAAKTGIIGLTRAAANDWGQYGITANCVMPMGLSDSWQKYIDDNAPGSNPFDALGVRRNAVGYAGDPERDVAPVVAFLCSDDARYVTGAMIPVDGGLSDLE